MESEATGVHVPKVPRGFCAICTNYCEKFLLNSLLVHTNFSVYVIGLPFHTLQLSFMKSEIRSIVQPHEAAHEKRTKTPTTFFVTVGMSINTQRD
jgi:hypothetical protein